MRVARHHVGPSPRASCAALLSPRVAQSWVCELEVRAAPTSRPTTPRGVVPTFVIPILGQKHQPVARESHLVGVRSPQSVRVARHRGGHGEGVLVVRSGWTRGGALRRLRVPSLACNQLSRISAAQSYIDIRSTPSNPSRSTSGLGLNQSRMQKVVPMTVEDDPPGRAALESMQFSPSPRSRPRPLSRGGMSWYSWSMSSTHHVGKWVRGNVHHPFRAHELFLSESRTPTAAAADDSARPAVGPHPKSCRTCMGHRVEDSAGATAKRRLVVDVLVAVVDVDVYGGGGGVLAELGDGGVVVSRGDPIIST